MFDLRTYCTPSITSISTSGNGDKSEVVDGFTVGVGVGCAAVSVSIVIVLSLNPTLKPPTASATSRNLKYVLSLML